MSKDILDIATGIFYESVGEASISTIFSSSALYSMLYGSNHNKTTLIKCEDYEKGLLPNTLKVSKPRKKLVNTNEDFFIINIITNFIYDGVTTAAIDIGIEPNLLSAYVRGICYNSTDLMYYKDFKLGLKKDEIFKGKKLGTGVIDIHTKEIYKTIRSLVRVLSVTEKTLRETLNNFENNMSRYIYLKDYDENKKYVYDVNTFVKEEIRKIINIDTMKEYYTCAEASRDTGIPYYIFYYVLKGESYNYTNIMYKDDFEKGLTPKSYYDKPPKIFRILDTETEIIYKSIRELNRHFKLGRNFLQTQTRFIRI